MAQVKVKLLNDKATTPTRVTERAAGWDLYACLDTAITILRGERYLIKTGIAIAVPDGYEGQVRPRSGLALKHGVTVLNTPGTIDADYRGEIGVILVNLGLDDYTVGPGDRIAQLVVQQVPAVEMAVVDDLDTTARGVAGFGSSGY